MPGTYFMYQYMAHMESIGQIMCRMYGLSSPEESIRKRMPWLHSQRQLSTLLRSKGDHLEGLLKHFLPPSLGPAATMELWNMGYIEAYKIVSDPFEACEAVQTAVFRIQRLSYVPDRFRVYFLRSVRNAAFDIVRRRRIRRRHFATFENLPVDIASSEKTALERILKQEQCALVISAIRELPHLYRAVISLRYYDNLSNKEISKLLGIPSGTVARRIHVAHSKLRTKLENSKLLAEFAF